MNIYITLDYELFLGRKTGTVKNCLVLPTTDLMDNLAETNTRVTFMVDGAYLCRLDELKDKHDAVRNDYEMVCNNLLEIKENGHSIQYHFHPQWLYSHYVEEKGWKLDYDHYKLSDVPKETLSTAFKKGVTIIRDITGNRPCAFRAGGFSLCSFDTYAPLFEENGIKLDSSVVVGAFSNTKFQVYNYKNVPSKSLYYFYDDICREIDDSSAKRFIEMPISCSHQMSSIKYMLRKRKMSSEQFPWKQYGDGIGVGSELTRIQRYKELLGKFFGEMRFGGSIDGFMSSSLWMVYEDCKKRGDKNMVILGHPKLATDKSLAYVKSFVNEMIKAGNEFHTLDEIVLDSQSLYGE